MSKGIFWFLCYVGTEGKLVFTGEIVALPIPCDRDGNPEVPASFISQESASYETKPSGGCALRAQGKWLLNSKNGCSNTHKDSWKAVTAGRKELKKIPWNYYPRGRVEISRGRALVFMNPQILNCENFLERIQETFGIGHLDIRVKIDNSAHYQCTILAQ